MATLDVELQGRIKRYAVESKSIVEGRMDIESNEVDARLDQTIHHLRGHVREQQRALEQLLAISRPFPLQPSGDPLDRLQQLRILTTSYKRLAESPPVLPDRESALPSILATHLIQTTIVEGKHAIADVESRLENTISLLSREESVLHDAQLLSNALGNRIDALQTQHETQSQMHPSQVAKNLLSTAQKRRKVLRQDTHALQRTFDEFVDGHLAAMLAAEELGGPVVGNMMDVEEDVLIGGFSTQGKPKKRGDVSDDKRQRRIDQIWGEIRGEDDVGEPLSEKIVAATELKELFESLVTALVGNESASPFVELTRDSAAARFLVRAKVAQFHLKDARKLRLIDFARGLDDQ